MNRRGPPLSSKYSLNMCWSNILSRPAGCLTSFCDDFREEKDCTICLLLYIFWPGSRQHPLLMDWWSAAAWPGMHASAITCLRLPGCILLAAKCTVSPSNPANQKLSWIWMKGGGGVDDDKVFFKPSLQNVLLVINNYRGSGLFVSSSF